MGTLRAVIVGGAAGTMLCTSLLTWWENPVRARLGGDNNIMPGVEGVGVERSTACLAWQARGPRRGVERQGALRFWGLLGLGWTPAGSRESVGWGRQFGAAGGPSTFFQNPAAAHRPMLALLKRLGAGRSARRG